MNITHKDAPLIVGAIAVIVGLLILWYFRTHQPIFVRVTRLSEDDGGGFLAEVPSMPGCATDGATEDEALSRVPGAMRAWKAMAKKLPANRR